MAFLFFQYYVLYGFIAVRKISPRAPLTNNYQQLFGYG